jgi:diguanylate cyclase (GGDEF)-like protein
VIGKKTNIMRSGKTPRELYESLWRHIRSGMIWHGEILNRKKDGELFWEDISISPINDDEGRITHYVAVKEDISERKRQEEQAWRLANYDSLTGLINRHYFLARLEQVGSEAQRYDKGFALLFIDLDGFKQVNDTLGHDAGDALLQEAAHRLRECVRESDTVARLGGDEFTIIMPNVDEPDAVEVLAKKVLASLGMTFSVRGYDARISASIGMAAFPAHGSDSDTLLKHADRAMYTAKAMGKNGYSWYGESGADRWVT